MLKNEIRGNYAVQDISYFEGVQHLASRLSMNPTSLGAYQNFDKISRLYKDESLPLKESKALFRPILPSQTMDKNFRNLNNNIFIHIHLPLTLILVLILVLSCITGY